MFFLIKSAYADREQICGQEFRQVTQEYPYQQPAIDTLFPESGGLLGGQVTAAGSARIGAIVGRTASEREREKEKERERERERRLGFGGGGGGGGGGDGGERARSYFKFANIKAI